MSQPSFYKPELPGLKQTLLIWGWLLSWCLLLGACFWLASVFYNLVVTLILSLFLTYLLLAPVNGLEALLSKLSEKLIRLKVLGKHSRFQWVLPKPRMLAVLVVYLLFFLLLLLGASRGFPRLQHQVQDLTLAMPVYLEKAHHWLSAEDNPVLHFLPKPVLDALPLLPSPLSGLSPAVSSSHIQGQTLPEALSLSSSSAGDNSLPLVGSSSNPQHWLLQSLNTALDRGLEFMASTLNRFIYFIALIVLTFYFLLDGRKLQNRLASYAPEAWEKAWQPLFLYTHQVMQAYIRGQVSLALLTGLYMSVVFSVFHVKYALLLGLWFTIAELFPVVGTWLGIIPSLFVAFLSGGLWVALSVFGCSYAYQTIKDNVLAPKITGEAMGLHPLAVIVSLLLGAKLAGLIGILLALPVAGLLKALIEHRTHTPLKGLLEKRSSLLPPSGDISLKN